MGIESTCDETGVALVAGTTELLGDVTATSMDQYARYGGIIPEIASRAHLESFLPTLDAALEKAQVSLDQVDAIAVCAGPGLIGSLAVGISAAKALAGATGLPLYGVNHVIGHLAVDQLVDGTIPLPAVGLIVSGGHTNLVLIRSFAPGGIEELGGTLDDAAGEAFDKVGRLLGLPYPGGPYVDKLSQVGNRAAIRFPRGLAGAKYAEAHRYDFSFSGLKTAVARYIESLEDQARQTSGSGYSEDYVTCPEGKPWLPAADICAGFSEAVNEPLVAKTMDAAAAYGCQTVVVGGGFSANSRLRELLSAACAQAGLQLRIPPLRYCTDNGAQIAALGAILAEREVVPTGLDFGPNSAMGLTEVLAGS